MGIDADVKTLITSLDTHTARLEKLVSVYKNGFDGKSADEAVGSMHFAQFAEIGKQIETAAKQTADARAAFKPLRAAVDQAEERIDNLTRDLTNCLVYWRNINRTAEKMRANMVKMRDHCFKLSLQSGLRDQPPDAGILSGGLDHPKAQELKKFAAAGAKICADMRRRAELLESNLSQFEELGEKHSLK